MKVHPRHLFNKMTYDLATSHQMTRDEIGSESTTSNLFKRFSEQANLIESATIQKEITLADDFILGHNTYGFLGASGYFIGDSGLDTETTLTISNPNNKYVDLFYTNLFTALNTGTLSNGTLTLDDGEYYESSSIAYDSLGGRNFQSVTINVRADNTDLLVFASADGGSTYLQCALNVENTFTEVTATYTFGGLFGTTLFDNGGVAVIGSDLRVLIINNSGSTSNITKLAVDYTLV